MIGRTNINGTNDASGVGAVLSIDAPIGSTVTISQGSFSKVLKDPIEISTFFSRYFYLIKPNENENDNKNDNVNDHKTEKDYSVVTLSDEERAALVEMSDNLTVENYINSLRNWQISNRKLISKPYVLIKRFIEEDAESRKKNPHFTSASKSQSFTVERLERLVKTYNDRNADSLGDEKPDVLL